MRKISCAKATGHAMRACIVVNMLAGLLLIIFGCVVQYPVVSLPTIGMVILGVFSILAATFGCIGSCHYKIFLLIFLFLGGLSTLLQMILVISLHVSFDKVLDKLDPKKPGIVWNRESVAKDLNAARWVFLVFLLIEIVTLIMAVLMRYCIPEDSNGAFERFDDATMNDRELALNRLRADIERGQPKAAQGGTSGGRAYDRTRAKMAEKYGKFSHGIEWKKKGWFGRG